MPDQTIQCPNCAQLIPMTQALSDQIKHELQHQLEAEHKEQLKALQQQTQLLEQQKSQLTKQQEKILEQQKSLEEEVGKRLEAEKRKLWETAQEKAKEKVSTEIKDLQEQFQEKAKQLEAAQQHELELRKKARELEEKQKNLELETQRKLDEERQKIVDDTKRKEAEENRLKLLEKDKQLDILKKTIEDLKRQSEQGSMQIQGEVQENDLKHILSTTFYTDVVTDVPTGIKGADLVQIVNNQMGQKAGVIVWEAKNTKAWSQEWVTKLKQDQGSVQADVCMLVSKVVPEEISGFGLIGGVWVMEPQYVIPLVTIMRTHLFELAKMKSSLVGREQKMEYLYQYLSGNQFKHRIEAIVLAFSSMKNDLDSERRAMERMWRKRHQEIERVIENTAGLYGDLQGIVGSSLPSIQALELPSGEEEKESLEPSQGLF